MKVVKLSFLGLVLMAFLSHCQRQVPVNNIEDIPISKPVDSVFANVYQPLDGIWKGTFRIYEDTVRRTRLPSVLAKPQRKTLDQLPIKLVDTLLVVQEYRSQTPYFQNVTINDFYPQQQKTVLSKGVNKVQDGKMWCVVHKPDDTVIHHGSLEGSHTIIWERAESNPQRMEYFRETVQENSYQIIGYGYYEGDDPEMMPRLWFYATYERQ